MSVELIGANEVIKTIEKLSNTDTLISAMDTAVLAVEDEARNLAPSATGELRSSIESHVEAETGTIVGIVSTPVGYAPYVEYGTGLKATKGSNAKKIPWSYQTADGVWHTTSGMDANPFLENALKAKEDTIIELLKESILDD